jgi:SAM-dependent methyltransferase
MSLRRTIVRKIYADHNDSKAVQRTLARLIVGLPADGTGLNIGAGNTRLGSNIRNLEIQAGPGIDLVGSVEDLPLEDETVDLVITQEVLEHVHDPFRAIREIARVLKRGGTAYVQLPFMIGYHGCPDDFWRFTHSGVEELAAKAGLQVIERGVTVGAATGFYRVAVEFCAILGSLPTSRLYRPAKGLAAILLYPIKWFDPLLARSPEAHRIGGGFFVVLTK